MKTKGNPASAGKGKRKKRNPMKLIVAAWFLIGAAFLGSRLLLNSYNASLSKTNTDLLGEISKTEEEIDQLQSEVNVLQDKTSVLGMLDYQVSDNQNNIYVIDNN